MRKTNATRPLSPADPTFTSFVCLIWGIIDTQETRKGPLAEGYAKGGEADYTKVLVVKRLKCQGGGSYGGNWDGEG